MKAKIFYFSHLASFNRSTRRLDTSFLSLYSLKNPSNCLKRVLQSTTQLRMTKHAYRPGKAALKTLAM